MRPQPIATLIASPLAKLPGVDGVSGGSGGETPTIPSYAVVNRDGSYILNRDGSYLVADPTPRTSA